MKEKHCTTDAMDRAATHRQMCEQYSSTVIQRCTKGCIRSRHPISQLLQKKKFKSGTRSLADTHDRRSVGGTAVSTKMRQLEAFACCKGTISSLKLTGWRTHDENCVWYSGTAIQQCIQECISSRYSSAAKEDSQALNSQSGGHMTAKAWAIQQYNSTAVCAIAHWFEASKCWKGKKLKPWM